MNPPAADTHGTAVAGIIGAVTNNALGIAALAPDVKLVAIRMMSHNGNLVSRSTVLISNAFERAMELGADVINCSWVLATPSKDVENAIHAALTLGRSGHGSVVVFAAGNGGGPVEYPARLSSGMPIIAVGATNEADELKTKSSSDGENWWGSASGSGLSLLAPGVHVVTTVNRASTPAGQIPFIKNFNGTSSAAPHVAAAAALLLSVHPDWSVSQVVARLVETADRLNAMPGIARLNICRALDVADCTPSPAGHP